MTESTQTITKLTIEDILKKAQLVAKVFGKNCAYKYHPGMSYDEEEGCTDEDQYRFEFDGLSIHDAPHFQEGRCGVLEIELVHYTPDLEYDYGLFDKNDPCVLKFERHSDQVFLYDYRPSIGDGLLEPIHVYQPGTWEFDLDFLYRFADGTE